MGYPGDGEYYVICDVCGFKKRARETVLVNDKYNYLNGMVVCFADYDKTNPQTYIKAKKERGFRNPRKVRIEGDYDNFRFTSDPDDVETNGTFPIAAILPGKPRYLHIFTATPGATELQWLGPNLPGSSVIYGYKIERESPLGGGFSTIEANTQSVATYYKDTTTVASTVYNYRVTAINQTGAGPASDPALVTLGI